MATKSRAERLAEIDALMTKARKLLEDEGEDEYTEGEKADAEEPEPEEEKRPSPVERFNGDFDELIEEMLANVGDPPLTARILRAGVAHCEPEARRDPQPLAARSGAAQPR